MYTLPNFKFGYFLLLVIIVKKLGERLQSSGRMFAYYAHRPEFSTQHHTYIYTQKLKQHKWPKHITEWNYACSLLKKTLRHSLKLMFQIIHLYKKIFLKMSSKYQKGKK